MLNFYFKRGENKISDMGVASKPVWLSYFAQSSLILHSSCYFSFATTCSFYMLFFKEEKRVLFKVKKFTIAH